MAKVEYKYPKDIVEQTRKYVDSCTIETMALATVEGLALTLDVDDDTLNEWAKKHDDFAKEFKRLKMQQKNSLIHGGAFGGREVNASMFIFLLKVNHGMVETTHTDVTTGGRPLLSYDLHGKNLNSGSDKSSTETS